MIDELTFLVDRVYKAELDKQKVQLEMRDRELELQNNEFQALQSQINPHFLYNTLETMNAYALVKGADEISEMAEALAYMFRYSVQNMENVKLVDELDHIRNYLIIQEHRLQRKIFFDVQVDPKWLLEDVVKLSLQPLVENAIEHGFPNKEQDEKIILKAYKDGDRFFIIIEDNGRGMSEERLREVKSHLNNKNDKAFYSRSMGIGIKNVHRRVQLIFGEEYGLDILSQPGKGTKVRIAIPAKWKEGKQH